MSMKQGEVPALVPQVFEHEQFGQVRVVTIDGEPKFVGTDVATTLGYANPRDALAKHVPDKFKRGSQIATPGGVQSVILIDEAGLYRLVFRSKLPEAEKFTDWACEIMVSVRKTGSYTLPTVATELERERLEVEKMQLATEQARLEVEFKRLALERDNFAKAQLFRELASASGDNQSMRNKFLKEAAKLLIGEVDDEEVSREKWL